MGSVDGLERSSGMIIIGSASRRHNTRPVVPFSSRARVPPDRPLVPTQVPHLQIMLTDDGSRTLLDSRLNETYHSGCGAISECLYVYLRNSGIEERLQQAPWLTTQPGEAIRVLEFGFGTGMAWLLTASSAYAYECPLHYVSLEHALLPVSVLEQLHICDAIGSAIARNELASKYSVAAKLEQNWLAFRAALPAQPTPGTLECDVASDNQLQLVIGDALDFVRGASREMEERFHAIYFDAFSPNTNPELWRAEMFDHLSQMLAIDGRLVSYCVNGAVRRALQQAGFEVERHPGPPGGKREVLVARLRQA